jgi:hypothetical protein
LKAIVFLLLTYIATECWHAGCKFLNQFFFSSVQNLKKAAKSRETLHSEDKKIGKAVLRRL